MTCDIHKQKKFYATGFYSALKNFPTFSGKNKLKAPTIPPYPQITNQKNPPNLHLIKCV